MGRPPLPPEDQGAIVFALVNLERKSDDFRKKRRELALKFNRTERAIDFIFERGLASIAAKQDGAA